MRSLKSASSSTRDSSRFKRKVYFRPVRDGDWRWLWAAYEMEAWKDVLQADLSKVAFQEAVLQILGSVDMEWLIEVPSKNGLRPVGLILADYRFGGRSIEPHIEWFPWATPRNKLEAVVKFMKETGRLFKVFVYPPFEVKALMERVWQYKVLKKGCKISDCYGSGEDAMMYYTPGPF